MPIKMGTKTYQHFDQAVAAVKRAHPSWSDERCRRYVGAIEKQEKAGFKGGK